MQRALAAIARRADAEISEGVVDVDWVSPDHPVCGTGRSPADLRITHLG